MTAPTTIAMPMMTPSKTITIGQRLPGPATISATIIAAIAPAALERCTANRTAPVGRWRGERSMESVTGSERAGRRGLEGELVVFAVRAVADRTRIGPGAHVAKRREHRIIESRRSLQVGDA